MIKYSDKYFDAKSSVYNKSLSELSARLMLISHNKREMREFFEDNGFECRFVNYHSTKKPSYSVGFAIGWKKSKKMGDICIISIRGTVKGEWYSNFDLFERNNSEFDKHMGFFGAAEDVIDECDRLFSERNNVHFLVTGHSRGGAVANIVSYVLSEEKEYTKKDLVFGITLASPNVSKSIDTEMNNIYNFVNKDDIITLIPLNVHNSPWAYKRYGETILMDINSGNKRLNKLIIKYYQRITGEEFVPIEEGDTDDVIESVLTLSPAPSDYYSRKSHAFLKKKVSMYDYFRQGILKILSGNSPLSGGVFLHQTKRGAYSTVTEYLMKYASGEINCDSPYAKGIECNHCRELYYSFVKAYNKHTY